MEAKSHAFLERWLSLSPCANDAVTPFRLSYLCTIDTMILFYYSLSVCRRWVGLGSPDRMEKVKPTRSLLLWSMICREFRWNIQWNSLRIHWLQSTSWLISLSLLDEPMLVFRVVSFVAYLWSNGEEVKSTRSLWLVSMIGPELRSTI